MRKATLTSTALLCAGPLAATAASSPTTGASTEHASRIAHQDFAGMRAAVPEPPIVSPSRRRQPYPYNFHETMG
jgi:hypothetical protein